MRTKTTGFESFEMYLKTVAELSDGQQPVSLAQVAERLGVTPVSAGEMVKRLVEQGYLYHERYKGVVLTKEGQTTANNVLRRQRLWECFLVDHLQLNWAGVYEIACRLEHATSTVLAEALDAYLGRPEVCPHGNPIPGGDGRVAVPDSLPLSALTFGQRAHILSVQPAETSLYAYLQARGLKPGQDVRVLDIEPLEGPMTLEVGEKQVMLGRNLAELLLVQLHSPEDEGE